MSSNATQQKKQVKKKNGSSVPNSLRTVLPKNLSISSPDTTMRRYNKRSAGPYRLHGEERVATVQGTTTVSSQFFLVQPAYATTLPTKYLIAQTYQRYKPRKVTLRYTPSVSGFSANGASGQIILCYLSDPCEEGPTTEAQAMSIHEKAFGFVTSTIELTLDNIWDEERLCCSTYSTPGDSRLYHAGAIYYVVVGTANNNTIGNLTMTYEFDLFDDISDTVTNKLSRDLNHFHATHTGFTAATQGTWTTIGSWVTTYPSFNATLQNVDLVNGFFTLGVGVWEIDANIYFSGVSVPNTIIRDGLRIFGAGPAALDTSFMAGDSTASVWGLSEDTRHASATVVVTAALTVVIQWYKTTITAGTTVTASEISVDFRRVG